MGSRPSLLNVNYHYIRDRNQYPYPGIHPIEPDAFVEQVRRLRDRYHMATPEEVEKFVYGDDALSGPSVFLTFDDGLADHAKVARSVLKELEIKAAFFVSSRPLIEHRALTVHRIHWLRANTAPEKFQEEFMNMLSGEWRDMAEDEEVSKDAIEINAYDSPEVARLKYLINFRLPSDLVDELSREMLRSRGISEETFCEMSYMSENKIRGLVEEGHVVGNHGHSHTPLAKLDQKTLTQELQTSNACLERIVGVKPHWISYPYGIEPENTGEFCRHFGFTIGLGMVRAWNNGKESPCRLNRVNPNDVASVT